jgi:hypothetical protein
MNRIRPYLLDLRTVLGAVGIASGLTAAGVVWYLWLRPVPPPDPLAARAILTVIPAPTPTPTITPLPTLDPARQATPTYTPGQIAVGVYVQITGTAGDGLRLRRAAGLDATPLFLGYDAEVFQVRDGPQEADGYVWWYLVAPYDENRAGWAAANFLESISSP